MLRLAGKLRQPVVLTGGWAGAAILLAADPLQVKTGADDPFALLDRQPFVEGEVPSGAVAGGWFGWLGFDPADHALGFYPNVLRFDGGQWWDEALVGIITDDELEVRRQALCSVLTAPRPEPMAYALGLVTPSRDLPAHVAAVERCIQKIRAGEIYQANICLTLQAEWCGSAVDLAADLIGTLEPPYGAYVAIGERQVASASPELFVRRRGRQVTSRPIKGTRPRPADGAAAEARRLAGSQKDRAENVMIVDLVRNDLSRVAETGSVRVPELLDVVAHPGVWHLVSTVEATLREGVTDADLLRSAFPPGSVSGTPKHRALEVIADLEDGPRGVYTGAIGYASPATGAEFSVAIRTVELCGSRFRLGVGGGITVDSTPVQEWWECFDKARPLLHAIGSGAWELIGGRPATDPLADGGICDTSLLRYGEPVERAEHLARLERAMYELYQAPLPAAAADALLHGEASAEPWQRQRIDIASGGAVRVSRGPAAAPGALADKPGEDAIVLPAQTGFGPYKWGDRRRHEALEAAHPGLVVVLADSAGWLETTRANVVAVIGGRLVTPALDGRILPGVTRTVLLELARDLGVEIELRTPDPSMAQAMAAVSSVAGMRWIRTCNGSAGSFSWEGPGELLNELSKGLVARWAGGATVRG